MRSIRLALVVSLFAMPGRSDVLSLSLAGTLATPEDTIQESFLLTGTTTLAVSTLSFGGGTNAAGAVIPPGGFDPLVALFSGLPDSASIVTIAGNPEADADTLSSFTGNCPPAGMVTIGTGAGSSVCGDDLMIAFGLPAGIYTLLLSDANYVPLAVSPGPPVSTLLSDGFTDFTGGVFQTCNTTADGTACIAPANNYAVDIQVLSGPGLAPVATPEPGTAAYLGIALAFMACRCFKSKLQNKGATAMKNTSKVRMTILPLAALLLQPAWGSVLFENNVLSNFQASGPVSLVAGQNASVCATNLDNSPVSVLIALLQADTGRLLTTKQQVLTAGGGTCLNFVGSPNQQAGGNVIGLVVTNAHLTELGAIVQDRPGGGGSCIAASVQIQATTINNTAGQTFLYVPMKDFVETGRPN